MKPKLLDLFCKAGGASLGYARAGFDVVGVDIEPQPRYPFNFKRSDVFDLPLSFLNQFDVIAASPPCQGYSTMRHVHNTKGAPRLIAETRELIKFKPYVIENVEDAREFMRNPLMLCGTMFGLGAQGCELRRHRLFEINFPMKQPACQHTDGPVIGVYGGHARRRAAAHGGRGTKDIWVGGHKTAAAEALGIRHMTVTEMSEAIPPAYTEYIGKRLMEWLDGQTT